jgi:hypothetical protein
MNDHVRIEAHFVKPPEKLYLILQKQYRHSDKAITITFKNYLIDNEYVLVNKRNGEGENWLGWLQK